MPASSNERSDPSTGSSAAELDGSVLHLSLWKPTRAASWLIPRFAPGECLISQCMTHHSCMMMRNPEARRMVTVARRAFRSHVPPADGSRPPPALADNATVDEFVDAGPSRRRARHPQPRGRASRARTTPQRPSCALQPPHSHPVACRCAGAQLLNFERGASDFNFILVLAAGRHPHLYQHHQR
jgi:hypothetical protein